MDITQKNEICLLENNLRLQWNVESKNVFFCVLFINTFAIRLIATTLDQIDKGNFLYIFYI